MAISGDITSVLREQFTPPIITPGLANNEKP